MSSFTILLSALSRGTERDSMKPVSYTHLDFDCRKAVQYGNATSSVKNTIPGDLPSSDLDEIETIIKAHNQKWPQSEMAR